jgi:predicted P-loop ATPase
MTVNEHQYLTDPTGNVRFWPVRATKIDIEALERDRDQLWAEAVVAFKAGEIPEPRSKEDRKLFAEIVEDRVQQDPWEAEVDAGLEGLPETTVEHVLTLVLDVAVKQQERKDQIRVGNILRKLGFRQAKGRPVRDGKRVRLYVRDGAALKADNSIEPQSLTPAESHAWNTLVAHGWTERVLSDGRRVWNQPKPEPIGFMLEAV